MKRSTALSILCLSLLVIQLVLVGCAAAPAAAPTPRPTYGCAASSYARTAFTDARAADGDTDPTDCHIHPADRDPCPGAGPRDRRAIGLEVADHG